MEIVACLFKLFFLLEKMCSYFKVSEKNAKKMIKAAY